MLRVLLAAVLAASLTAPTAYGAATRANLPDIEDEVMCPVCGTPLNLAESPQADRERSFIRARISRGESKQQIKRELVDQYGPQVLATPRARGFDLAAYLVPLALVLVALAVVGVALARWRRRSTEAAPAAGAPGGSRLAPADAARLDEDLARFDG